MAFAGGGPERQDTVPEPTEALEPGVDDVTLLPNKELKEYVEKCKKKSSDVDKKITAIQDTYGLSPSQEGDREARHMFTDPEDKKLSGWLEDAQAWLDGLMSEVASAMQLNNQEMSPITKEAKQRVDALENSIVSGLSPEQVAIYNAMPNPYA